MRTIALIPAYKPNERLIDLVMELKKRGIDPVVVDDGSSHKFDEIFDYVAAYARVVRYSPNKGKGEALKHGLSYIKEHFEKPYVVVTADADGQHRVEDIIKVSQVASEHKSTLVLGKRILGRSAPFKSRLGNGTTRLFYYLTTGRRIYETQTGLRAFDDSLLDRYIDLPGHRYEYEMDVMLISSDIDIIETQIETVYFDNNSASHFRAVKDTHLLHREYARYKIPSLITAVFDYLAFALTVLLTHTFLIPNICVRTASFILKFILCRTVKFSEKAGLLRYLLTSAAVIILDTLVIWGFSAIGMNVFIAKLISGILMIGVSIGLRILFERIHIC